MFTLLPYSLSNRYYAGQSHSLMLKSLTSGLTGNRNSYRFETKEKKRKELFCTILSCHKALYSNILSEGPTVTAIHRYRILPYWPALQIFDADDAVSPDYSVNGLYEIISEIGYVRELGANETLARLLLQLTLRERKHNEQHEFFLKVTIVLGFSTSASLVTRSLIPRSPIDILIYIDFLFLFHKIL